MAGYAIDIEEVVAYEDLIIPAGKYQAEILKAKFGTTMKGKPKFDLTVKIIDTIPPGEEIDTASFDDPIDKNQFAAIYLPNEDSDTKAGLNFKKSLLRDWLKYFDVDTEEAGKLNDTDFEGCIGGIQIVHEKMDKSDPESPMRAVVKKACAMEN